MRKKPSKPRKRFLSYEEAKEFAHLLKLNSASEWFDFPLPKNLPKRPHLFYEGKGWTNWYDFLGKPTLSERTAKYVSFEEAKAYAQQQDFKTGKEYLKHKNHPNDIPKRPHLFYAHKGWKGWNDFLGTQPIRMLTFKEARLLVHSLNLKNFDEYKDIIKNYPLLPSVPQLTYKNKGWAGVKDFLGRSYIDKREGETRSKKYKSNTLSYEDIKTKVQPFKFKGYNHYRLAYRLFKDIMFFELYSEPRIFYKDDGWVSSRDFLGLSKHSKMTLTKKELKLWFRSLPSILDEIFKSDETYKKEFTRRLLAYYNKISEQPDVCST